MLHISIYILQLHVIVVVLFCSLLFICFPSIHKLIDYFPISLSVHKVFNYMCVCVCVQGKEKCFCCVV